MAEPTEEQIDETVQEELSESTPELSEPISQERVVEIPLDAPEILPRAKARGQRGKDKKQRAKPKPKAKSKVVVKETPIAYESSSESSADEATIDEIRALNMIRSIRSYHQTRDDQRRQLYASWFGR